MKPRVVLFAFLAAVVALHAVVSWLSPRSGEDWDHAIWATQHLRHESWWSAFFATHFTFSDVMGYVLARSTIVHTIVTPLVGVALLWGTFALATRRRPRVDDWQDVAGLVLIAALIWITAPRAGLVFFHRPFVATWLYGTTLAIWFLVPFRLGMRPRGVLAALIALAGLLVATSTRQLGIVAIFAVGYAIAKTPRSDRTLWQWVTLVSVLAGTAIGFVDKLFDFRGYKPTFERSLDALNLPIFEGGELLALVLGLVLLKLLLGKLWPRHAGASTPDTREALPWLGVWFGYVLVSMLGPQYKEATLFPASVVLVIGAYPYVRWTMTSRPVRIAVLALGVAINAIVWWMALPSYLRINEEFRERIAVLEAAPPGSVATVKTYRQIRPTFWALGEDWADVARRQLIATQVYGLRDIEVSPAFRRLESNPRLTILLEVDGVTPDQLRAAGAPESWPNTLKIARVKFSSVIENLQRVVKTPFAARLVVSLELDVLRGRRLFGAVYEHGRMTTLRITRKPPDDESRQGSVVRPRQFVIQHPESYVVIGDRSAPIAYTGKGRAAAYRVQALTTDLHAIVACDPQRCFLVDAFIPAL